MRAAAALGDAFTRRILDALSLEKSYVERVSLYQSIFEITSHSDHAMKVTKGGGELMNLFLTCRHAWPRGPAGPET